MTYPIAIDAPASNRARERLEYQFRLGKDRQERLLQKAVALVIRDRFIDPLTLRVDARNKVLFIYTGKDRWAEVHSHALGQICDRANPKLPRQFIRPMVAGPLWQQELAQININSIYRQGTYLTKGKERAKFLGRFVGPVENEQMRGFVSQYFARHLATLPMLRGFIAACEQDGAQPIDARSSDMHFSLKCFLPFVFEPIPSKFYTFGVEFSNSDFADGSLKIALCSRNTDTNTNSVIETSWSKTHLGSIIKESELVLSASAMAKEVDAVVAILKEAVHKAISPENVTRLLYVFDKA